jgi:hypothetical protein
MRTVILFGLTSIATSINPEPANPAYTIMIICLFVFAVIGDVNDFFKKIN